MYNGPFIRCGKIYSATFQAFAPFTPHENLIIRNDDSQYNIHVHKLGGLSTWCKPCSNMTISRTHTNMWLKEYVNRWISARSFQHYHQFWRKDWKACACCAGTITSGFTVLIYQCSANKESRRRTVRGNTNSCFALPWHTLTLPWSISVYISPVFAQAAQLIISFKSKISVSFRWNIWVYVLLLYMYMMKRERLNTFIVKIERLIK